MIREEDLFNGFTIGEWEVLPAKGVLRRGEEEEHPEPKVFAVLVSLARRDGNLVTKDELIDEVWEGRAFDNQPIQRCIALLRKHLHDTKPFQYIETLQRRGYRLVKPIQLHMPPEQSQPQVLRESGPSLRLWKIMAATIVLGFLATIVLTMGPLGTKHPVRSIVVLPFENMTGDPDQEYFSDGLSEELLNSLAQIPELTVISRYSAFSFKGKNVDMSTVAKQLDVSHVLEGSVRKMGNRVRITAQLIEASTDSHLWSNTYERDVGDIFAVQEDIARRVVTELQVTLLGEVPDVMPTDTEAYSLYLQAQHVASQGTPEAYHEAILLLRRVLSIDESYAPAWSALSGVFSREVGGGLRPFSEGIESARVAANKALELDPNLASAHIEMAWIAMSYDWDYASAIAHLGSVSAKDVRIPLATSLALQFGRYDLAVDWGRQAIRLDPVSPRAHRTLGLSLTADGRFAEAEQVLQKAIMLSPRSIHAQGVMAVLRLEQGMPEAAMQIAEESPVEEMQIYLRSMAMFAMGDILGADEQLDLYIQKFADESASSIAAVYAFREQPDLAFQWLERGYENRDNTVSSILLNPPFRKLDNHPKMQPFLSKIGLSDEQLATVELDFALSE